MHLDNRAIACLVLSMLLTAGMAVSAAGAAAQDATPEATPVEAAAARPAHIHAGSCPEVGDVVAPLNDLTAATGGAIAAPSVSTSEWDAVPAEYSFTTVPLTIDEIVTGDYAINVHQSAESIETYIACGDLDGILDANGSLVVGLREVSNSGYTGTAVLSPSPAADSTDVSVFIARGLSDDMPDEDV